MSALLRSLLVFLAVLSVGTLQVFGIPAGYLCACTGANTVEEECETVVCHPDDPHVDGCGTDLEHEGDSEEPHDSEPGAPTPDGHKHKEVREALKVTGFPPTVSLPAVVMFVLPPAFPWADVSATVMPMAGCDRPGFPRDGSPPTPLLVARTMVMLV